MYKAIIWDFDGTLFNSYPHIVNSFKRSLMEHGIYESYDDILSNVKVSVTYAINKYKEKYNISDEIIQLFCKYEAEDNYKSVKPYSGAVEICEKINHSGGRNYMFTHRGKSALKYLNYYKMDTLFYYTITKDNNFRKKPEADAIFYIIEKFNEKKDDILMIGDRKIDIIAAHNAGIKACLFDPDCIEGNSDADYKIKLMDELSEIIGI
ncbi:HAD-IA family hydrolase [Clostridium butanoliproducens]|uniref:HAD-IA family hydrolase n=1 Tax=Clostridium butanoliproducens TaxID=2991837 RepID=UPI0024BB7FF6|nr:HAD-IA family hydrolase [Clostridium butanoliproducens]